MPPNPPFDMMTTRSPARCSRTMAVDDVLDRAGLPRPQSAVVEVANQLRHRQPLGLRQRRAEHRGDDDAVGRGERPGEVVLKDPAAGRCRARLEHRPHARVRMGRAQACQRFGHRRRMVREIVVDRDPIGDADDFQAPLDARKRSQAARDLLGATPTSVAMAMAASALRTLCAPTSGASNAANGEPPRRTRNLVSGPDDSRSCACQSTSSPNPKVSTRDTAAALRARAPSLSAPRISRPRRGTRLTRRRNASETAARSA